MDEGRGGNLLEKTTDTKEFEEMINAINHLKEEDAKSLLNVMCGLVVTAMTGDGGNQTKVEVVNKLSDIYRRIPDLNEMRSK